MSSSYGHEQQEGQLGGQQQKSAKQDEQSRTLCGLRMVDLMSTLLVGHEKNVSMIAQAYHVALAVGALTLLSN